MIDSLERGVVAGTVAGGIYGLFTWLVISPFVGYLERVGVEGGSGGEGALVGGEGALVGGEGALVGGEVGRGHEHAGDMAGEAAAAVAVDGTVTAAISAGGGVLWGVLLGAAFGAAYYLFEPALPGGGFRAYVLAGAGFLVVSAAPWTVLPPVAPGVERAYDPAVGTALYVGLMLLGAVVAAASVIAYNRASATRGRRVGAVAAGVPLAGLALLAVTAPSATTGGGMPAGPTAAFRWLVVFGQAGLWALIAAGYRRLERRAADRPESTIGSATRTAD